MFGAPSKKHRNAVYALLDDLLPVLQPGATLQSADNEVLLPVGDSRVRASTDSLLRLCADQPRTSWPSLVERWLADVQQASVTTTTNGVDPSRLRVQAVPRSSAPAAGVSATFNSAFDLLVVEDLATSSRRLLASDLSALGMTGEEAVTAALNTTISEVLVRLDVRTHELPGGSEVRMASADGVPYVSAGITSVRQLAGVDSPYGTLVGVPRHSMIVLQPVTSRLVLDGLGVLTGLVGSMYDSGADRCARDVYWFANGDAYPVGTSVGSDGRPEITLPAEVASVVASLPG